MSKILVEICCGSAEDVFAAKTAGADRVELNSAMFLGGLTPSLGELRAAREAGLPIMAMLRPRSGGFCYTEREFKTMLYDAEALLEAGADGLVFGILLENGQLDIARCAQIRRIMGDKPAVFHRAMDVVPDWRNCLDELVNLGFTRILTSGRQPSVREGTACVRAMREYAAGRIEILPGAGITAHNVAAILEETGSEQIHLALNKQQADYSTEANPSIFFGGALYPPENRFEVADSRAIRQLIQSI